MVKKGVISTTTNSDESEIRGGRGDGTKYHAQSIKLAFIYHILSTAFWSNLKNSTDLILVERHWPINSCRDTYNIQWIWKFIIFKLLKLTRRRTFFFLLAFGSWPSIITEGVVGGSPVSPDEFIFDLPLGELAYVSSCYKFVLLIFISGKLDFFATSIQ